MRYTCVVSRVLYFVVVFMVGNIAFRWYKFIGQHLSVTNGTEFKGSNYGTSLEHGKWLPTSVKARAHTHAVFTYGVLDNSYCVCELGQVTAHAHTCKRRYTRTQTHTHTERERDTFSHTYTHAQIRLHRQTDRQTDTHTHPGRERRVTITDKDAHL